MFADICGMKLKVILVNLHSHIIHNVKIMSIIVEKSM